MLLSYYAFIALLDLGVAHNEWKRKNQSKCINLPVIRARHTHTHTKTHAQTHTHKHTNL